MYFSLDPETALSEVLAYRRYQGLPDAEATPLVLVSCQANVRQILDLSDRRIRQLLGLSQNQLVTEPWRALQHAGREALTQAIGRLARKAGLEGLLTPSAARPRGMNLVLFRDRVSENQLSIVHPEKFPMSRRQRRP
jgi:RES domain-containing protein